MLWLPATVGEQVFLTVYDRIGRYVDVGTSQSGTLDFLTSEGSFREFARLIASIEIFLRIVRTGKIFYQIYPELPAPDFGKRVLRQEELIDHLRHDNGFYTLIKQVAQISSSRKGCPPALERATLKSQHNCYMCGREFIKDDEHSKATIEHLWPLGLGGESLEENVVPGCQKCNNHRGHAMSWAWGPVQSTYHYGADGSEIPNALRISLGLARLMQEASGLGENSQKPTTLKVAALALSPLLQKLKVETGRHHLYFEIMKHAGVAA
ncbi:MAG: hypothetical protein RL274_2372 [Pseudomonadota bacterium]